MKIKWECNTNERMSIIFSCCKRLKNKTQIAFGKKGKKRSSSNGKSEGFSCIKAWTPSPPLPHPLPPQLQRQLQDVAPLSLPLSALLFPGRLYSYSDALHVMIPDMLKWASSELQIRPKESSLFFPTLQQKRTTQIPVDWFGSDVHPNHCGEGGMDWGEPGAPPPKSELHWRVGVTSRPAKTTGVHCHSLAWLQAPWYRFFTPGATWPTFSSSTDHRLTSGIGNLRSFKLSPRNSASSHVCWFSSSDPALYPRILFLSPRPSCLGQLP